MTNDDVRLWLPWMLTLLGTLIVVPFTACLNTQAVMAKFDAIDERFAGIGKRLDGLHEEIGSYGGRPQNPIVQFR